MKKLLLILLCFPMIGFGQIDIEDKSSKPPIKSSKYNGEFMTFNNVYDNSKKSSVVGELVTLIDVSTYEIFQSENDRKKRTCISYKMKDLFSNKTFKIINYKEDIFDYLEIKNESGTFIWEVGGKYVFNKYIDNIKDKYEGKTFIPIHLETEFESLSGENLKILGEKKYKITAVIFAKLKFNYGIVFRLNDSFECVFPNGSFDQPRIFNGEAYVVNENYINIQSSKFSSNVLLIEENEFNTFLNENRTYLSKIRGKKVQIGMTEKQCRFSWGTPSTSYTNIALYDKVLQYGDISNSQNLYFKNDKLELIK